MKRTKRPWTRAEKLLFLAPILLLIGVLIVKVGPQLGRKALGAPELLPTEPYNQLWSVRVSDDGNTLAATGTGYIPTGLTATSGTIYLWNAQTLAPLPPIAPFAVKGKPVPIAAYGLAFSPDSQRLGFSFDGQGNQYTVINLKSRKIVWTAPISFLVDHADFSHDGKWVALAGDKQYLVLNAANGSKVAAWKTLGNRDLLVRWSPDSQNLITISGIVERDSYGPGKGGKIELRDKRGKKVRVIGSDFTQSFNFSPDGKSVISTGELFRRDYVNGAASDSAFARCYDVNTGNLKWEKLGDPAIVSIGFKDAIYSPDGKVVAVHSVWGANNVLLLDANNGREIRTLSIRLGNTNAIFPQSLAFSPHGKRLFVRGQKDVLVWTL